MSSQATSTKVEEVLHEPIRGRFLTQHSTMTNRDVAMQGLILLCEVGSTLHGVSQDTSGDDVDEMGICIEDPLTMLGLDTFEQYEYRTQPVNHRSGPGDIDRVVYGLRKWAGLAAKGNPTVLMPLFAPVEKDRIVTALGQDLLMHGHLFISKQAGHKFLGYLNGQIQRYLDPKRVDSKHASRPELVAKHGWDTKTGYHALRLAVQGIELMQEHTLTLPMRDDHREWLLGVRNGEFSKDDVTTDLNEHYIPSLKRAIEESTLPDEPDREAINRLLVRLYQAHWAGEDHV